MHMRIQKLNSDTKKNLLEDLLKRSPNNYGQYEASVKEILDKVKEEKVPTVLKMELSNDNIAKAIAEATGTDVKVFYSCHNLTAQEFKDGETYLSMMEKNVETLKEVLNGWH